MSMKSNAVWSELEKILIKYVELARNELTARWDSWEIDLTERERYEVIGALLARQVSLATQLAKAPQIWNRHIAPLILRAMTDVHITIAWIFCDPFKRAKEFIRYGLGQEKLTIEHIKNELEKRGQDPLDSDVGTLEEWINAQRYTFLTEVNVGAMSGKDTRKMADEAGCSDLYRFAYRPYSTATHSMWNHIGKCNVRACTNPLHGFHLIPDDPDLQPNLHYLLKTTEYLARTFALFDEKACIGTDTPSASEFLDCELGKLGDQLRSETTPEFPELACIDKGNSGGSGGEISKLEGSRIKQVELEWTKRSKKYNLPKYYLYWWDISPKEKERLKKTSSLIFVEKDTGRKHIVFSEDLLNLLKESRRTTRGQGNWGIKILVDTPDLLQIEERGVRRNDWAPLPAVILT